MKKPNNTSAIRALLKLKSARRYEIRDKAFYKVVDYIIHLESQLSQSCPHCGRKAEGK